MPQAHSPPLELLEAEVGAGHPERAVEAAVVTLSAKAPPLEAILAAARGAATHLVPGAGQVPHGLVALASAAALQPVADSRARVLAVLQAVAFAASPPKSPKAIPPPLTVRGDVSHLGPSALFASRRGDLEEAESLFLGIVKDGSERRQAGDMLFRAAVEDLGDTGHKLIVAVQMWRLGEAVGFRDARLLLRPAVQYLVCGERDRLAYETMLAVLGREWVDLEPLASGVRPFDDAARGKLAAVLAAPSQETCVEGILSLLQSGIAPGALADGIASEAAKRALAAEGYALETAHGFLFADAARFALTFSRTSERVYALFLAALRCRSPSPDTAFGRVRDAGTETDDLRLIQEDLDARRPADAASRVREYLSRGRSSQRLVETLVGFAVIDSSLSNQGHNLALAEACIARHRATQRPEFLMALAKLLAASPRDDAAARGWSARLGP